MRLRFSPTHPGKLEESAVSREFGERQADEIQFRMHNCRPYAPLLLLPKSCCKKEPPPGFEGNSLEHQDARFQWIHTHPSVSKLRVCPRGQQGESRAQSPNRTTAPMQKAPLDKQQHNLPIGERPCRIKTNS